MNEAATNYITELIYQLAAADTNLVLFLVLLVSTVIVLDAVTLFIKRKSKETGVQRTSKTVSIEGSKTLPDKNYVSEIQGLAGRPDALLVEDGFVIPVERKPLAKKIRDRYVAQLLVYMRLVEEFEGKKPPYGYLILGPNCRRFKIHNTDDRQAWLQGMLDEMRNILEKKQVAKAAPHRRKCQKCNVKEHCLDRWTAPQPQRNATSPHRSSPANLQVIGSTGSTINEQSEEPGDTHQHQETQESPRCV